MSYANGTPFLNLAQTIGTDHRDWFDENAAKLDLDTKMKTLWDGAADTATILSTLQENVGSLQTDVTTLEGVVSGHTSTITTINESLVLINTALNALNTQVTNKFDSAGIADPYDASYGIYAVGDVVTYNGQRYVCSTAVTAAEPFDVSKWTAEDIQTVIDQINNGKLDKSAIPTTDYTLSIQPDNVNPRVELDCSIAPADNYNPTISMNYHSAQGVINDQLLIKYDGTNFVLIGTKGGVSKTATISAT